MKVIGAGCPRTGTLSTRAALTRLGLPCYHMAEVALHEDHERAWYSLWLQLVEAIAEHSVGANADRDRCIAAFNAHNRRVQEEIPKDRLLVFRVQDGWAPLCEFLGCEVPDEPFPHLNAGADAVKAGLSFIFGIA